jgi:hypothetical protein
MQWRVLFWTSNFVFLAAVLIAIAFRNKGSATELGGGRIEFAPSRVAFASWLIFLAGTVFIGSRLMMRAGGHLVPFASGLLFCAGVVYFLTMGLPGKIIIDDRYVAQTFWLGAAESRIPWSEIEMVQEQRLAISIVAPGHRPIVHWSVLPDRPRLVKEIELRRGEVSADSPESKS